MTAQIAAPYREANGTTWGQAMEPRAKLWIEADGRLALSDYRVRLLSLIAETGSLARAASAMKLSYRRAWGKVKEIEANLGVALVESETGGAGGGHTRLTAEGARLVQRYEQFRAGAAAALVREYAAAFGDIDHATPVRPPSAVAPPDAAAATPAPPSGASSPRRDDARPLIDD